MYSLVSLTSLIFINGIIDYPFNGTIYSTGNAIGAAKRRLAANLTLLEGATYKTENSYIKRLITVACVMTAFADRASRLRLFRAPCRLRFRFDWHCRLVVL